MAGKKASAESHAPRPDVSSETREQDDLAEEPAAPERKPGELEAAWREEREDGYWAPFRQTQVMQFFQNEGASDMLRKVKCRETICQVVLDYAILAANAGERTTAMKLGTDIVITESDFDHVTVLVPFQNIEELPR